MRYGKIIDFQTRNRDKEKYEEAANKKVEIEEKKEEVANKEVSETESSNT